MYVGGVYRGVSHEVQIESAASSEGPQSILFVYEKSWGPPTMDRTGFTKKRTWSPGATRTAMAFLRVYAALCVSTGTPRLMKYCNTNVYYF